MLTGVMWFIDKGRVIFLVFLENILSWFSWNAADMSVCLSSFKEKILLSFLFMVYSWMIGSLMQGYYTWDWMEGEGNEAFVESDSF